MVMCKKQSMIDLSKLHMAEESIKIIEIIEMIGITEIIEEIGITENIKNTTTMIKDIMKRIEIMINSEIEAVMVVVVVEKIFKIKIMMIRNKIQNKKKEWVEAGVEVMLKEEDISETKIESDNLVEEIDEIEFGELNYCIN